VKVGIIGAGQIGSTLARKLKALGHEVNIANSRGPQTISPLASELGITATTASDAIKDVDLAIISIPIKGVAGLPKDLLSNTPVDLAIVDTCNYYPKFRDDPIEALENGEVESVWLSQQIGLAVVKAFNNITATSLAAGPRTDPKIALPVAGDDPRAKALIMKLVNDLGFEAVDAGKLSGSWRQQPGTPCYCTDMDASGLREALSKADRARAPRLRDEGMMAYIRSQQEKA